MSSFTYDSYSSGSSGSVDAWDDNHANNITYDSVTDGGRWVQDGWNSARFVRDRDRHEEQRRQQQWLEQQRMERNREERMLRQAQELWQRQAEEAFRLRTTVQPILVSPTDAPHPTEEKKPEIQVEPANTKRKFFLD